MNCKAWSYREEFFWNHWMIRIQHNFCRQTEIKPEQEDLSETASHSGGTFRIRLALAGVLFLTILLLDQNKKCFAGISMDQIFQYVTGVDYGAGLKTWVETVVNGLQVQW